MISRQNFPRCTDATAPADPGQRIDGRNARSAAHCRRTPLGSAIFFPATPHLLIEVLRRPVESALRPGITMYESL